VFSFVVIVLSCLLLFLGTVEELSLWSWRSGAVIISIYPCSSFFFSASAIEESIHLSVPWNQPHQPHQPHPNPSTTLAIFNHASKPLFKIQIKVLLLLGHSINPLNDTSSPRHHQARATAAAIATTIAKGKGDGDGKEEKDSRERGHDTISETGTEDQG